MLPDGAETQLDDWTIFFLNQTPFNTISPVLALDTPEVKAVRLPGELNDDPDDKPDLLCVLNLVRTKHDKTLSRYVVDKFGSDGESYCPPLEVPKFSHLLFVRDIRLSRYLR